MSHDYAMSRVRDAIEKAGGNHLKAQRIIFEWAQKDMSLLAGLASPHINGIITHALSQANVAPKKPMPKQVHIEEENLPPPGQASQKHIDAINLLVNKGKKDGQ